MVLADLRGPEAPVSRLPFLQVDAFTDRPLGGNPCAIVFDADALDDDTMLAVAREMNLSETSFVLRPERAAFRARYFTPVGEIPMAGHPTVATVHALVEAGRLPLAGDLTHTTLELPAGVFPIEVRASGGRVHEIAMTQQRPRFVSVHGPEEVLPVFGLAPEDLLAGAPIETVSTGTPQLFVPLAGHDALRRARPVLDAYAAYRAVRGDFFSVHLFCLQGVTPEGGTFARHFAPPPNPFEDPVTGSATGGMGAWLWHHGRIDAPRFVAEQGHWMGRPGRVQVEVLGPRASIEGVRVGGSAVTVVRGELAL